MRQKAEKRFFSRNTIKGGAFMKKYGFPAAAGAALFIFAAVIGLSDANFSSENVISECLMLLSDACLLPGVVLLGVGGLIFVSGTGMFDIISYTLMSIAGGGGRGYYEYKSRRKQGKRNPAPTLFAGVGFLILSIVFGFMYCLFI